MSEQNIYEDFTPQKGKKSGIWNYFHIKVNRSGTREKVMYIVRYVTVPCHTIHALQTCGNMSTGNTGRLFMFQVSKEIY